MASALGLASSVQNAGRNVRLQVLRGDRLGARKRCANKGGAGENDGSDENAHL